MNIQIRFTFALAAMLAACAPTPADSVSFSGFTGEQLEVAYGALDQWCEAVGWCPVVTLDGELRIDMNSTEEYLQHGRRAGSAAHNGGDTPLSPVGSTVHVDGKFQSYPADVQWVIIAHELGHEGSDHTRYGLMNARPRAAMCIDQWAVRAWCSAVGCPQDAASTCSQELESAMVAAIDGGD